MTEYGPILPVYLAYISGISRAVSAGRRAYTGFTRLVQAAGTVLITVFAANAASAGVLSEFETRCLTPMVEVRESDLTGLTRIPHRAAWESWVPEAGDWELRRALPGAVVQYCAIIGEYTHEESGAWAEAAVSSGDYEMIETEPLRLLSTFLREPRIEVEFDTLVPSVTVIETNLES